jgi:ribosomal protein S18
MDILKALDAWKLSRLNTDEDGSAAELLKKNLTMCFEVKTAEYEAVAQLETLITENGRLSRRKSDSGEP